MSELTVETLKQMVKEIANESGMEGEVVLRKAEDKNKGTYNVCEFAPKLGRTPESVGRFVAGIKCFLQTHYDNLPGDSDSWGFSVQLKTEESGDE